MGWRSSFLPTAAAAPRAWRLLTTALAAWLASCSSTPPAPGGPADPTANYPWVRKPPAQAGKPAPSSTAPSAAATRPHSPATPPPVSSAGTPRDYRADAATHLYQQNQERIYPGRLPPMLYAIGVLDVDLDSSGQVRAMHWRRAPSHAPEVVAEIERTVRQAAPFPAPRRLGRVTYTDTWLWDKSGRFQLDTLSEGQN